MYKPLLFLILVLSTSLPAGLSAQNNPLFGSQVMRQGSGFIRVAEIGQLVDTVSVWGDLRDTGKFLIPKNLSLADLISLAAGPNSIRSSDVQIDWSDQILEVSVITDENFEKPVKFRFNYAKPPPVNFLKYRLQNRDVVIVQVKRRRNYRDWIQVVAPSLQLFLTSWIIYTRVL